jgi:hypothetical protein
VRRFDMMFMPHSHSAIIEMRFEQPG